MAKVGLRFVQHQKAAPHIDSGFATDFIFNAKSTLKCGSEREKKHQKHEHRILFHRQLARRCRLAGMEAKRRKA